MNTKESNNTHISKYISLLHKKGRVFIDKEVSKFDLGPGQFMLLLDLYREDGKNQEVLSENLKIDKTTTARAIKKLEKNNYVIKVKDDNDKRNNNIFLTDKAKDIKDDIFEILKNFNDEISNTLSVEEEILLKSLLKKVCDNINL